MEVALSDDQEFFRDTTRKFLEQRVPDPEGAGAAPRQTDGFERDYWRQGAELGWMSLLVPEELGGGSVSGNGVADLALVADAFGAHVAPGPLLPCNVVAAALARSGHATSSRPRSLPAIIAGEVVATWAVDRAATARPARRRRRAGRGRRRRLRAHRREGTGRGRRRGRPAARHRDRPTPASPSSSSPPTRRA